MGMKIKKPAANKSETIKSPVPKSITPDNNYPVFCFRYLVRGYAVEDCDKDNQAALMKRLAMLSRMTWDEIRVAPRHGLGAEKIKRDAIDASIPAWLTVDIGFFLSFRYNGLKPFVGHQQGQLFHVLWVDHSFDVYNHGGS